MPWLILHPLLPLLLLTAYFVGDLWDNVPASSAGRMARVGALAVFGLLATYSLHSAVGLTFYREADPVEPLVYVQSAWTPRTWWIGCRRSLTERPTTDRT
jgi:predicted membrane-bound mannosyltransferase